MFRPTFFINKFKTSINLKRCTNFSRFFSDRNILSLNERGFFQELFPDNAHSQVKYLLNNSTQSIYAGFDPTAESLHVGNLLVIMGLIHCQRAGHIPIALLGGATAKIGDPSGRSTERTKLGIDVLDHNLKCIEKQIGEIFQNHEELFWTRNNNSEQLKPVKILNNADWYKSVNLVDFISTYGRHFRMGQMLSRSSVQTRLQSESGMSFTEFTYQIFQAYDWYHLCKNHECRFQLGGSDQMGNLMTGHELNSRTDNKAVYGMTLPLVTTEEGDKFGKSAGNAIWLSEEKTSPFSMYQFFIRVPDSDVEKMLKLFTFLPLDEIRHLMQLHKNVPELRDAQKRLAQEITLLVHGKKGLKSAETVTSALYKGNVDSLGELTQNDFSQTFAGATCCELLQEPGMSILDISMKAKCFPTQSDAIRIISAGGFYVNQKRATNISEIISPGIHILKNGITLIRVGKKNYYIIKWLS